MDTPSGEDARAEPRGALAKIEQILRDAERDREGHISLGALSDAMEERAFGLLMLILALPCTLPFVYLLPQLVALPMMVLAWQMAAGRRAPWLPETLRKRRLPVDGLMEVVARVKRYAGWLERLAHPRLAGLTGRRGMRVLGALLIVPCLSILVPLPLTNTVPGIGVAIAAAGLIERDGIFVMLGLLIGLVWVSILAIGGPALLYFLIDWAANRGTAA
ncbi:exopolysaccharide biosynthesis protein [Oricola cellulosilytica]|uniref:Exopolysaccharide biosynthesis protein n=1 Tax=Oricola cellulosilytica TaxID=1429082 RepID=A0A4V2MNN4_9HYPH|nr:exopolysaccharide biosynthesis protein [Oricola cellulosilytica]TCD13696.1 exopolysaccharide biosynthesis protein [Oricola cellulosilytica]